MTVTMEEPVALEELLDALELPLGYKAEIVEGQISVTPPPSRPHESVFSRLSRQIQRNGDWFVSGNTGLITPLGRFIPDLTVAIEDVFEADDPESWCHPEGVVLVAEITSSNPSNDRDGKRRGYAAARIPLYLLIDRSAKQAILFSDPVRGDYATIESQLITDPIPLPAPFSFTLENLA
jgi:Uma2 family endonuclease